MKKAMLFVGIIVMAVPVNAATVLFIGDRDDDVSAVRSLGDDAMISWLTSRGNSVIDRDDEGSGSGGGNGATGADLAAANLVVISASVGSSNVKSNDLGVNDAQLLAANIPIINMEGGLADEFGAAATGGWNFSPYDSITTVASGSPLMAGLGAPGPVQITNSTQDMIGHGSYNFNPAFDNLGLVSAHVDGAPIGFPGAPLAVVSEFSEGDGTEIISLPFGEGSFQDRTAAGDRLFANAILQAGGMIPEPASLMLFGLGASLCLAVGRCRR